MKDSNILVVFLLILATFCVDVTVETLTISRNPVEENTAAILTCTLPSYDVDVIWHRNNSVIARYMYRYGNGNSGCNAITYPSNAYRVTCYSTYMTLQIDRVQPFEHNTLWDCLSSTVTIYVAVPVTKPDLTGDIVNNNIVYIESEDKFKLISCTTNACRPQAVITWYINSSLQTNLSVESNFTGANYTDLRLLTTSSTFTVPYQEPGSQSVYCKATQSNGISRAESSSTVDVVFVEKPSTDPNIFANKNIVYIGDLLNLNCTQKGGYPLPKLWWQGYCEQFASSYTTNGDTVETSINIIMTEEQTGQSCTCMSYHISYNGHNKTVSYMLNPYYTSEQNISLSGYETGRILYVSSKSIKVTCELLGGNPKTIITWVCDGKTKVGSESSEMALEITPHLNKEKCVCFANHTDTSLNFSQTEELVFKVHYKPAAKVKIKGNDQPLYVGGKPYNLTCIQEGGNPLCDLKWNCLGLNATTFKVNDVSMSSVVIQPELNYDGQMCQCISRSPDSKLSYSSVSSFKVKVSRLSPSTKLALGLVFGLCGSLGIIGVIVYLLHRYKLLGQFWEATNLLVRKNARRGTSSQENHGYESYNPPESTNSYDALDLRQRKDSVKNSDSNPGSATAYENCSTSCNEKLEFDRSISEDANQLYEMYENEDTKAK